MTAIKCWYCDEPLDEEKAESPHTTPDGEPVCDECYHDHFEFTCCWCQEYGDAEDQHKLLVVFDAEEAFDADARERGLTAGLYRIAELPYYTSDYLSVWLNDHNLERIGPVPRGASGDGYTCGHLCGPCQGKIAWPYEVVLPGEPVAWAGGRRSAEAVAHCRTLRVARRVARTFGPEAIARRRDTPSDYICRGFYDPPAGTGKERAERFKRESGARHA